MLVGLDESLRLSGLSTCGMGAGGERSEVVLGKALGGGGFQFEGIWGLAEVWEGVKSCSACFC